jgi:ribosomal protein S3AE
MKVSRAIRRTLRNSAKNWIIDYLKTKTASEVFEEILSNQFQKPLSLKLKKTYPLAICEIRVFEIKKSLGNKEEQVIGEIEVKSEEIKTPNTNVSEEEVIVEEQSEEKAEKPKKKAKKEKKGE